MKRLLAVEAELIKEVKERQKEIWRMLDVAAVLKKKLGDAGVVVEDIRRKEWELLLRGMDEREGKADEEELLRTFLRERSENGSGGELVLPVAQAAAVA